MMFLRNDRIDQTTYTSSPGRDALGVGLAVGTVLVFDL